MTDLQSRTRWLVSATLLACALAWPGFLLAGPYEDLLRWALGALTGVPLAPRPQGEVDLAATNILMLYLAACAVTTTASWGRRLVAASIGVPLMMLVELATGLVSVVVLGGAGATEARMASYRWLLELPQLLSAPVIWLVLLGPRPHTTRSVSPAAH